MSQLSASLLLIRRTLSEWWYDWFGLTIINVVWVIASLTIVLAPPATLAAFYVMNQLAQGRGSTLSDFVVGFRRYFLISYVWALVNVAVGILAWVSIVFYEQLQSELGTLLRLLVITISFGWLVVQFYALPYLIEQEQKNVLLAFRNGLFTGLASPLFTLVLILFSSVVIVISVGVVALILLGGPCLIALLANHAVRERLTTFGIRPLSGSQP